MNPNLIRIVISVVLIAHGLVHVSLTNVPLPKPGDLHTPFWPSWWRTATDPAWLASKLGLSNPQVRGLGCILWVLTMLGFGLAGLGLLGVPGLSQLWSAAAGLGAGASLVLLVLYWHPWLFTAVAINLIVFAGLGFHLPEFLFG